MATGAGETSTSRPKDIGSDYGRTGYQGALGGEQQGRDMLGAARDLASDAKDKILEQAQEQVQDRKNAGAEYLDGLAGALDRVAGEFDRTIPFAGDWMRTTAQQLGNVAQTVRDGDAQELARKAQDFARRQPTLCFGLAMVAGFGLARMFKAAGGPSPETASQTARRGPAHATATMPGQSA